MSKKKRVSGEVERLVSLHNALVAVRHSMKHPRMDANVQFYECLQMILPHCEDDTLRSLRAATISLQANK